MQFIVFTLVALIISFAATPVVIFIAKKYNCVDNPGVRRFHSKATPRWGGIAFYLGVLPALIFILYASGFDRSYVAFLSASCILIVLGAVDDLKQLGWKPKFLGMIAAASIIMFGSDFMIKQIGTYGSIGKIELGVYSIPFTYFSIVGVTNSINLIDGLNGLAGGTALLGFLFMGIAAFLKGNVNLALLCFSFVGALLGFLRYNYAKAKIFMGDSGSLFLGFSVATVAILLTQNELHPIEPTFPVLVMLLPIFDTLRVMFLRIFNLRNPFIADKSHLHHLIVRRKVSSSRTVASLWLLTALFGILALIMLSHSSILYAIVILCSSLLLSFFAEALAKRR